MPASSKIPADLIASLSDELLAADQSAEAIAPLSVRYPDLSVDDAYSVQKRSVAQKVAAGRHIVGHKIGLTSEAIQQQLGVDQPDFGVITDEMVVANRGEVSVRSLIAPRVEAEFAFRLGKELPPTPSREQLVDAIDGVAVALEIIDSRVADWKIALVDTVADNASSAKVVVGEWVEATPELLSSLPKLQISLSQDQVEKVVGPGSAVLGDPLESVLWLAQAIGRYGEHFRASQFIIAGAVAAAVTLTPGSEWSARADDLPGVRFSS